MHSRKKRLCSVLVLLCLCVSLLIVALDGTAAWNMIAQRNRTTLKLWYTDEDLTDYLNKESVLFNERQGRTRLEIRIFRISIFSQTISLKKRYCRG